ncbi:hypothetical protein VTJ04DRAFT_3141 [Mycothermus thermophilus]|uniref:uncharacterized protein n=1 Tax=Humicola insolens TaxID=85995 RepID=UPI003742FDA3
MGSSFHSCYIFLPNYLFSYLFLRRSLPRPSLADRDAVQPQIRRQQRETRDSDKPLSQRHSTAPLPPPHNCPTRPHRQIDANFFLIAEPTRSTTWQADSFTELPS